jgi:hypothetical protein
MLLDCRLRRGDLMHDLRVLLRRCIDRLDPSHEVVQARRAEQHRERGVLIAGRVGADEAPRELLLRMFQARARNV